MSEDKLAKVKSLIAEQLEVDEDKITVDTRFVEDLEADSLDIIELVMAFEEEYDKKIPDEELEKIKTVGDIIKILG
ncbi:MAG: acyl carrier protein [Eubacteriaceae bacterium]|jgi:acyl carrier protein|nr:acyl carrier protein [Eubacteriaceae bacterium]MDD4507902.1 acyl carrier protein [Eubacteriaceae bacterium]